MDSGSMIGAIAGLAACVLVPVFFAVVLWTVVRARQKTGDLARGIRSGAAPLAPWPAAGARCLSRTLEGTMHYTRGALGHRVKASGYVAAVDAPTAAVLGIALDCDYRQLAGSLQARTAEVLLEMEIRDGTAWVRADGSPFGVVSLRTGELWTATDQPVGRYDREPGVGLYFAGYQLGGREPLATLRLRDREVAVLDTRTVVNDSPRAPLEPLVVHAASEATPEDDAWLLVVAVLEHGYHGVLTALNRLISRAGGT